MNANREQPLTTNKQPRYDNTAINMSESGTIRPHSTPPACDCAVKQRSHRATYLVDGDHDAVIQAFIKGVESMTPAGKGNKKENYKVKIMGYTSSQMVIQRTMANGVPFIDDCCLEFKSVGTQVQIDFFSFAVDAHFFSALCWCCCHNVVGRYLAWMTCCCGGFITKDWGANEKLIGAICASTELDLKLSTP